MANQRINFIRKEMSKLRLQALLITESAHVRYLTGFSGSSGMCIITPNKQFFITDRRYKIQSSQEIRNFSILITKQNLFPLIAEKKLIPQNVRIGFEGQQITVSDMKSLKKILPNRQFIQAGSILESVTEIKDEDEVELIRSAAKITDKVFKIILNKIRPGVRECDIAAEIGYYHRKYGAECDAFDPIVASGERGALPHARASEKIILKGEMVVLDFGCRYRGYHSDLTRTIAIGKPTTEMRNIYQIVLDAQMKAIDAARAGVPAFLVDSVARKHIKQKGYGRYFIHSLGHGLGIHVHDPLRVSVLSEAVLKKGNVVTIEPGIYLPDRFGIRIEDDIVIRDNGCDVLTTSNKELIII